VAYADVPAQAPTSGGLAPVYTAADAAGQSFYNDDRTAVIFKNTSGAPVTVTAETPGSVDGLAIPDKTISVPATTGERWCKFDTRIYNQPPGSANAGKVQLTFSAVTNVTLAVIRI
jgi:zona occludens toxin (predicted ATPase)